MALALAIAYRFRCARRRACLAVGLGGSSDVIGVLAFAISSGFTDVVLVQPGSTPSADATASDAPHEILVPKPSTPQPAPGGDYFNNASMLEYLLSSVPNVSAGYYLVQQKDVKGGFSHAALEATSAVLQKLASAHRVDAVLGLDFGGDVAIPPSVSSREEAPPIEQRDMLNLRAVFAAARSLHLPAEAVASAPGVDGAGAPPEYLRAVGDAAVRTLEMSADGALLPSGSLSAPPACTLPLLPPCLFERRLPRERERAFSNELVSLSNKVLSDVPPAKRCEHASKTYWMLACIISEEARKRGGDFVALGRFRSAEKARAHMHSTTATGLFDLAALG